MLKLVNLQQQQLPEQHAECVCKERTISLGQYENTVTNPIHYKKPPRRKTEKVATPRGGKKCHLPGKFTAWLLDLQR
jgi:hypothetical protein